MLRLMVLNIDHLIKPSHQQRIVSGWGRLRRTVPMQAVMSLLDNRGFLQSAYMAYMAILSLFPLIIALSALASLFGNAQTVTALVHYVFEYTPPEVAQVLVPIIQEVLGTPREGVFTVAFLGALWTASGGVEMLRDGLNRAFEVKETRPLWRRRAQGIVFILAIGALILLASVIIVLGPALLALADRWFGLSAEIAQVWHALRYAAGGLALLAMFSVVYYFLPNVRLPFGAVMPGAATATLIWLLLGSAFSFYLRYAGSYSVTYGSLAGILITLLFFQFSALIFLFGAEVNQALWNRRAQAEPRLETPATAVYDVHTEVRI